MALPGVRTATPTPAPNIRIQGYIMLQAEQRYYCDSCGVSFDSEDAAKSHILAHFTVRTQRRAVDVRDPALHQNSMQRSNLALLADKAEEHAGHKLESIHLQSIPYEDPSHGHTSSGTRNYQIGPVSSGLSDGTYAAGELTQGTAGGQSLQTAGHYTSGQYLQSGTHTLSTGDHYTTGTGGHTVSSGEHAVSSGGHAVSSGGYTLSSGEHTGGHTVSSGGHTISSGGQYVSGGHSSGGHALSSGMASGSYMAAGTFQGSGGHMVSGGHTMASGSGGLASGSRTSSGQYVSGGSGGIVLSGTGASSGSGGVASGSGSGSGGMMYSGGHMTAGGSGGHIMSSGGHYMSSGGHSHSSNLTYGGQLYARPAGFNAQEHVRLIKPGQLQSESKVAYINKLSSGPIRLIRAPTSKSPMRTEQVSQTRGVIKLLHLNKGQFMQQQKVNSTLRAMDHQHESALRTEVVPRGVQPHQHFAGFRLNSLERAKMLSLQKKKETTTKGKIIVKHHILKKKKRREEEMKQAVVLDSQRLVSRQAEPQQRAKKIRLNNIVPMQEPAQTLPQQKKLQSVPAPVEPLEVVSTLMRVQLQPNTQSEMEQRGGKVRRMVINRDPGEVALAAEEMVSSSYKESAPSDTSSVRREKVYLNSESQQVVGARGQNKKLKINTETVPERRQTLEIREEEYLVQRTDLEARRPVRYNFAEPEVVLHDSAPAAMRQSNRSWEMSNEINMAVHHVAPSVSERQEIHLNSQNLRVGGADRTSTKRIAINQMVQPAHEEVRRESIKLDNYSSSAYPAEMGQSKRLKINSGTEGVYKTGVVDTEVQYEDGEEQLAFYIEHQGGPCTHCDEREAGYMVIFSSEENKIEGITFCEDCMGGSLMRGGHDFDECQQCQAQWQKTSGRLHLFESCGLCQEIWSFHQSPSHDGDNCNFCVQRRMQLLSYSSDRQAWLNHLNASHDRTNCRYCQDAGQHHDDCEMCRRQAELNLHEAAAHPANQCAICSQIWGEHLSDVHDFAFCSFCTAEFQAHRKPSHDPSGCETCLTLLRGHISRSHDSSGCDICTRYSSVVSMLCLQNLEDIEIEEYEDVVSVDFEEVERGEERLVNRRVTRWKETQSKLESAVREYFIDKTGRAPTKQESEEVIAMVGRAARLQEEIDLEQLVTKYLRTKH